VPGSRASLVYLKYVLPEAKVGVEICFQDSAVEKAEVVKVLRLLLAKLEEE